MKLRFILLTLLVAMTVTILSPSQIVEGPMVNVGVSYFGIQSKSWPCAASYDALKKVTNLHLSFVFNSFGNETKCLDKFIQDTRLKTLEVHLSNGAGLRNNRLFKYELMYGETVGSVNKKLELNNTQLLHKFGLEAKRLNAQILSKLQPGTQCVINPILENNLTKKAGENLYAYLKPLLYQCKFVWNKVGKGEFPIKQADFTEGHGTNSKICTNCITNLDGSDINFHGRNAIDLVNSISEDDLINFLRERSSTYLNFLWVREFNGNPDGKFIDLRSRKNFPSKQVFELVAKYIVEAQQPPMVIPAWSAEDDKSLVGCKSFGKAPDGMKGFILKQSDVAIYGMVVLLNGKYIDVKELLVLKAGKLIEIAKKAGVFPDGDRPIYRFKRKAVNYPFNIVLKSDTGVCWKIANPKVRID